MHDVGDAACPLGFAWLRALPKNLRTEHLSRQVSTGLTLPDGACDSMQTAPALNDEFNLCVIQRKPLSRPLAPAGTLAMVVVLASQGLCQSNIWSPRQYHAAVVLPTSGHVLVMGIPAEFSMTMFGAQKTVAQHGPTWELLIGLRDWYSRQLYSQPPKPSL